MFNLWQGRSQVNVVWGLAGTGIGASLEQGLSKLDSSIWRRTRPAEDHLRPPVLGTQSGSEDIPRGRIVVTECEIRRQAAYIERLLYILNHIAAKHSG